MKVNATVQKRNFMLYPSFIMQKGLLSVPFFSVKGIFLLLQKESKLDKKIVRDGFLCSAGEQLRGLHEHASEFI
jgi:hypothetical protein